MCYLLSDLFYIVQYYHIITDEIYLKIHIISDGI